MDSTDWITAYFCTCHNNTAAVTLTKLTVIMNGCLYKNQQWLFCFRVPFLFGGWLKCMSYGVHCGQDQNHNRTVKAYCHKMFMCTLTEIRYWGLWEMWFIDLIIKGDLLALMTGQYLQMQCYVIDCQFLYAWLKYLYIQPKPMLLPATCMPKFHHEKYFESSVEIMYMCWYLANLGFLSQ